MVLGIGICERMSVSRSSSNSEISHNMFFQCAQHASTLTVVKKERFPTKYEPYYSMVDTPSYSRRT